MGHTAARRLGVAVLAGAVGWVAAAVTLGAEFGPVVGWIAAALVFLVWTWAVIRPMDAASTRRHALREDPAAPVARIVLTIASLASLGGVAVLFLASTKKDDLLAAALGVLSVAASWVVVHTLYTLRYAADYYSAPTGGIDFNQKEEPAYLDFAYVGFTLGMTYQVSDTTISSSTIRRIVLEQSLLSYLLGAVVVATTVNLVIAVLG
ncbi:putative membrane protein [Amnibacterium kyonggiense]|uniref:Putative membrane protein n=2 Tax=Amnibacterium kyonggiense TaxID=595671 RepID=A0A4R7FMJ3_9MICO|nr:putative membrane protein [Amnibacterium kyonggiense]